MTRRRWTRVLGVVIVIALCGWGYSLIAVRGTFAPFRSATSADGSPIDAGRDGHRIVGRVFTAGSPGGAGPLVVVLHGDAPFIHPGYQYAAARKLADAMPGARVAALLRPGYADVYGARSDGDRGFATGDTYTREVADDLAAAILSLRQRWTATKVILVGHSGGAAIAANVAASAPGLIDHVVLVACPCDVPAFRRHMAKLHWDPMWLVPTRSLSPLDTLDGMAPGVGVSAISGVDDPVTLPAYARAYVEKAKARGLRASITTIPNEGHEVLDSPVVVADVSRAADSSR